VIDAVVAAGAVVQVTPAGKVKVTAGNAPPVRSAYPLPALVIVTPVTACPVITAVPVACTPPLPVGAAMDTEGVPVQPAPEGVPALIPSTALTAEAANETVAVAAAPVPVPVKDTVGALM
jgi:hypothetical protein